MTKSILVLAALSLCLMSLPANASDLTLFGGVQRPGQLTFQTVPGNTQSFVQTFNPKTFGVFGLRLSEGKVIGAEHTIAYAPNFIESGTSALIYHSNLLLQLPIPVVKPYGTVGLGLIHSGGITSFGTKLIVDYGGGVKVMAGPTGLDLDIRGYRAPKISLAGLTAQQRLDFFQVSAGVVFKF
jgi:hypothetical protein